MTRVLSLTTTEWRSFYESQLAALEHQGIEVTSLEPPGEFRAFDEDIRRRSKADYLRFYGNVVRQSFHDHDLVHANYGLTIPVAMAQPTRPVVATLWGGEFTGNSYARWIKLGANRVDELILPSNAIAQHIDRPYHYIPFPVDTALFRPIEKHEARERVGWEADEPIVLFPSAPARYEKNFPLAKRVVEQLPMEASIKSVANAPYEEVPYYMNASDVVLVTSRWESGPMVVKEAVACNVPVVSTDVGFVAEVIDGVSNSHIAADEASLVQALETVIRTGERADGRSTVADYDLEAMGGRLSNVYQRALDA